MGLSSQVAPGLSRHAHYNHAREGHTKAEPVTHLLSSRETARNSRPPLYSMDSFCAKGMRESHAGKLVQHSKANFSSMP